MKKLFVYSTFAAVVIAMSGCTQTDNTTSKQAKAKTTQTVNITTADGTYVGLADTHTVEINLASGTQAFQFPPEMASKFDGLAEGTKVQIKYEKNNLKEFVILEDVAPKEVTGTYTGLADTHTVEIITDKGPKTFQINEDLRNRLESLPEGTVITVQYDDNMMKDFQTKEDVVEDTGVYVGLQDPHTVEIETANGSQSYQLSDEAKVQIKQLKKDDSVNFQYLKNANGQLLLKSIQKK